MRNFVIVEESLTLYGIVVLRIGTLDVLYLLPEVVAN